VEECEICEMPVPDRENDLVGVLCDDCAAVEFGRIWEEDCHLMRLKNGMILTQIVRKKVKFTP